MFQLIGGLTKIALASVRAKAHPKPYSARSAHVWPSDLARSLRYGRQEAKEAQEAREAPEEAMRQRRRRSCTSAEVNCKGFQGELVLRTSYSRVKVDDTAIPICYLLLPFRKVVVPSTFTLWLGGINSRLMSWGIQLERASFAFGGNTPLICQVDQSKVHMSTNYLGVFVCSTLSKCHTV